MEITAKVVGYSENEYGDKLLSVLVVMPKFLLGELNKHRMFSNSTSSVRAIAAKKMQMTVLDSPVVPMAWMQKHSGMQGFKYFDYSDKVADTTMPEYAEQQWLRARDAALQVAVDLDSKGVTKQMTNRLLEPFMWARVLITGGMDGWGNFFLQRISEYVVGDRTHATRKEYEKAEGVTGFSRIEWMRRNRGTAEIHMRELAEIIYDAYREATPRKLAPGEWHLPMYNPDICDNQPIDKVVKYLCAVHANTSYTVVGDSRELTMEEGLEIFYKLIKANPIHYAPLEHCAVAMTHQERSAFAKTLINGKKELVVEYGWCNNFRGFIQYRYMFNYGYDPYGIVYEKIQTT